jgi:putative ABC transport system substrate-binding protein
VGDTGSVPRGAIAAYGLDYFLIGYTAGKQAAKILKGEKPGDVPAGMASGYSLWINLKAAQIQGAKIDKAMAEKAADKLWDEQGNVVKGK